MLQLFVCVKITHDIRYAWSDNLKRQTHTSVPTQEKYDFRRLAMVGDGATDLEARQPGGADIFIGYGGVVERPSIAAKADWYVYDIRDLIQALQ